MDGYLSHFSAALLWDIPYIEAVIGPEVMDRKSVDYTTFKRSSRFAKKGRNLHIYKAVLPARAVVERKGKAVASPELLFVQLATKLDIHRLILLGLQLCHHSPGKPNAALTTKERLWEFVETLPRFSGVHKALRALKYIENGSASIMESLLYMILTLPNDLGGYGLTGAVFNQEFSLNEAAGRRLGQNRCFVDLYYSSVKVAVEYDSLAFHGSPAERGKDAVRSEILFRQGIEVVHMNTIQLYDKDACADFAFNLATRLGKRIRIRSKKFDEMERRLRSLLPS